MLIRTLEEFGEDAHTLDLDRFEEEHGLGFFLRAPSRAQTAAEEELTSTNFRPLGVTKDVDANFYVYPVKPKRGYKNSDSITVGRLAENDVHIRDTSISRRHAIVRIDEGSFEIIDQASGNGTAVGDTWLQAGQVHPMPSESAIQLGSVALIFVHAEELMQLVMELVEDTSMEASQLDDLPNFSMNKDDEEVW